MLSVLTDISALYELAPYVGSVFQHPKSQFYTLLTDTEIVFACENLGLDRGDILSRFEKTVTALHLEKLLGKSLFALSGGEKQKIACASVCALMPDIFVLDEPTSNLDIGTIRDMQAILMDWKRQGKTIIIAEHRLAWLCGIADRVLYFQAGEIALDIAAERFWALPVDEFHRMGLRTFCEFSPAAKLGQIDSGNLELFGFRYEQKNEIILDIPQLSISKGAIVAVLGNNGAGKTTFARSLCGLIKKAKGTLCFDGKEYAPEQRMGLCYMVMQDVNHQLFSESVLDEAMLGIKALPESREAMAEQVLSDLDLLDCKDAHPMSLSGGQRQRVAIAGAITSHKEIIVFDEPTSGLDYRHMQEVASSIRKLSDMGKTQFVITHDPDLVAACCNYFVFMEAGKVVCSGYWNETNQKYIADYFSGL